MRDRARQIADRQQARDDAREEQEQQPRPDPIDEAAVAADDALSGLQQSAHRRGR